MASTLELRLVEMKTSNVATRLVVEGLKQFKADLEAQGVAVTITIEDWHPNEPVAVILQSGSAMLKDYYVTYHVNHQDDDTYSFCGGENIAAVDRNDAIHQVEMMMGKRGRVVIDDVECISDEVVE